MINFLNEWKIAIVVILIIIAYEIGKSFINKNKREEMDTNKNGSLEFSEVVNGIFKTIQNRIVYAFNEALTYKVAENEGYDAFKEKVLGKVNGFIQITDTITDEQKKVLTPEAIEKMFGSYIKSLYDLKFEDPNKPVDVSKLLTQDEIKKILDENQKLDK